MKIYKVAYSEFVPVYDIEVEAENESEAHDKAKEVLSDTDIGDFEIWRVEEVKKDNQKEDQEKNSENRVENRLKFKRYKIQEVIKPNQVILVQVIKDERGQKGAALSTFISIAGKYIVLMPNTPKGGGISRKIFNPAE